MVGEPKTETGKRKILLPPSTFHNLKKRRETTFGEWIFPNPLKPENPVSPNVAYRKLKEILKKSNLPDIRFHDLRHTAATNMHQLTGDFYTVGEVLGHTLAGIGVSLGLSMNFEAVTARYVDVRLERKKEVLDAYHGAVKQADPAKAEKAEPKKAKSAAKKKSSDLEL